MSVTISYNKVPLYDSDGNYIDTKMGDMPKALWKTEYIKKTLPWDNMFRMLASDYRCYSAGIFKDGISSNENWIDQPSVLILDIDDGLTLNEAKELFSGKKALVSTTRNHQKLKNDVMCDRFRVILPLKKPITCTAAEYSEAMTLIHDIEFPFVDKACKDPSRIYFGHAEAEHFYLDGQPFDFDKYLARVQQKKKMKHTMKRHIQPKRAYTQRNATESTQRGFYERTWCTTEMLEALKFGEKFVSGNRNNALLSWTKFFKDLGFSDAEVREVIFYINSKGDSVEESEIEKTIFRSQRIQ